MINIYGKGGHAKVVDSTFKTLNFTQIRFWDQNDSQIETKGHWIIAIGNNKHREAAAKHLGSVTYTTLIAPSAQAHDCQIEEGAQIMHCSVIQCGSKIGKHCIINTSASIDHDCIIEDFSFVGPNATLCGNVKIGKGSLIGAGAVILPNLQIGENCIIGAGTVVTKNVFNGLKVYGNPAKVK